MCDEEKLEYLLALSSAEGDDANYVVVGMSGHMPFLAGIIEDVLRRVNIEDCVHLAGIASATVLRRMFEGKEKPDATDEEPGL